MDKCKYYKKMYKQGPETLITKRCDPCFYSFIAGMSLGAELMTDICFT